MNLSQLYSRIHEAVKASGLLNEEQTDDEVIVLNTYGWVEQFLLTDGMLTVGDDTEEGFRIAPEDIYSMHMFHRKYDGRTTFYFGLTFGTNHTGSYHYEFEERKLGEQK